MQLRYLLFYTILVRILDEALTLRWVDLADGGKANQKL
jgi:hypothetical protein